MVDLAMELLKNVTSDGGFKGDYSLIVPDCFVIPDEAGRENSEVVDFNWSAAEPMASEGAFLQCKYDLAEHYFFLRQYKAVRDCMKTVWSEFSKISVPIHAHFTLDVLRFTSIVGYCRALQIDTENVEDKALPKDKPVSQQSWVSRYAEEEKNVNQKSFALYAQTHSSNFLLSMNELFGVTERDVQFLRQPENAATFCTALKSQLSSKMSPAATMVIQAYLRFLCSCYPSLLDALKGCGVLERLHSNEEALCYYTFAGTRASESALDLTLLSRMEPPWQVLHTFDSNELKTYAQRTTPNRVSSHYLVPVSVQPLLLKLPAGIYQDMVALAACKAQQLTQIGATAAIPALLDLASHEARSALGETAPELTWDLIRLELVRWHNLLHRCSDVQKMGQMTTELANKVKSFIAVCGHKGAANINWELYMLVMSFLLNTCDWTFIILHCPSFHRFANFGKVLASLCYDRGYAIDAALIVCEYMKLNCSFQWYDDIDYGDVYENGTSTGVVAAVQHEEIDLPLPVFQPTFPRFRAVSFSHIFSNVDLVLVTRAPSNSTRVNWHFLFAFQWPNLCALFLAFLSVGFLINLISRFRKREMSFLKNFVLLSMKNHDQESINDHPTRLSLAFWS